MPTLLHVVARALPGRAPFRDPYAAWWMWRRLRVAWPSTLAACLMPNHLHWIGFDERRGVRARLGALLSGFSRHVGERRLWDVVPEPSVIDSTKQLARQVRYVHLNPCRAGLVTDPLAWPYSTHRGVIGAEVNAWLSARVLARALAWQRRGFEQSWHEYVSGDPSVRVAGTPFPRAAPSTELPAMPLASIAGAALSATPWSSRAGARHAMVLLARDQGWGGGRMVAKLAGIGVSRARKLTISDARHASADAILSAARLCLGDARLRIDSQLLEPLATADPGARPRWNWLRSA